MIKEKSWLILFFRTIQRIISSIKQQRLCTSYGWHTLDPKYANNRETIASQTHLITHANDHAKDKCSSKS